MLAIFRKGVANPPEELKLPEASEKQAMHPEEILRSFHSSHSRAVSTSFADGAALAYSPNFSSLLISSSHLVLSYGNLMIMLYHVMFMYVWIILT